MIVLDTHVISELMLSTPDARVMAQQSVAGLFTTMLTRAEIFYGLALLPQGRRHDDMVVAAQQMLDVYLAGGVLSFDIDAAMIYAEIAAGRRRIGKPLSQIAAQIAAVVRSRGAELATRNVPDFVDCGIVVVNRGAPDYAGWQRCRCIG